jgi:hypothetical protein
MKIKAIIVLLFLALKCPAAWIITNEVNGTFDATSYDTVPYNLCGNYFATYFYNMYPQFTNHIYSVSRSGASWQNQFMSQQEKYCLPLWASFRHVRGYDWVMPTSNGGYNTTNPIIQWGTNLFNAPPLFWNGTSITNEGTIASALSITHYTIGSIPNDSPTGDEGEAAINLGAMQLAQQYGSPQVDLWHMLWTNGWNVDVTGPRLLGFYTGGHPYPAGHLAIAIQVLRGLGADTNVGSVRFDWKTAKAATNHCVVQNISTTASNLTASVRFDRMPMAWDVPDGAITNDARGCFIAMPSLGNAFNWTIQATNLPTGTYGISVDGVLTDVATDAQLAAGRNWFTNYNGPLWTQRVDVLRWKRHQEGVDPVTLVDHSAGDRGFISGVGDNVNFQSNASQQYDVYGKRGDLYVESIMGMVSQMRQYDDKINAAAQQAFHTLTISPLASD